MFVASVILGVIILRLPILAAFGIQAYGYLGHLLLFLIPFFLKGGLKRGGRRFSRFHVVWVFISLFYFIYLLFNKSSFVQLRTASPFLVVSFFPLSLDYLGLCKKKLEEFVSIFLKFIFYFGSIWLLSEYVIIHFFNLLTQCGFASWLEGAESSLYCGTSRKMVFGFTNYKDTSVGIIVGSYFSFGKKGKVWERVTNTTLLLLSLIIVDSLTWFGVSVLLGGFCYWGEIKRKKKESFVIMLVVVNVFLLSPSYLRSLVYFYRELNLNSILPSFYGCNIQSLIFNTGVLYKGCSSNEVHSLFYIFSYGFLPTLGWYCIWLFSLYASFSKVRIGRRVRELLNFNLAFILAGVHYSGAESWGVNIIFMIIYYLAFQKYIHLRLG